jgi:hypothetical protein
MAGIDEPASTAGRSLGIFSPAERDLLLSLQRQALSYFLENQAPGGLMFDRQRNHGPRNERRLCSTSATGMGLIAVALASAEPHHLISRDEAVLRIRAALQCAEELAHDRGMLPHFLHPRTGEAVGADPYSTIDTSWLLAGALWAATFLRDQLLADAAHRLFERVDWTYWTAASDEANDVILLRHGRGRDGNFLRCCWDRLNGETIFMYVMAVGAPHDRALGAHAWNGLRPFYGTVAGHRFNNADLGLFVFQYGLDLLDLRSWFASGAVDLMAEAATATTANHAACREAAADFRTYRRYWGLSAGDGPGEGSEHGKYRVYSPAGPIDGTAHITATLASISQAPEAVMENLQQAKHDRGLKSMGRYGFSSLNVDRGWVARDMIGIDAGAAVLALDNFLAHDRVRATFHLLPCVGRGLERLNFVDRSACRRAS